MLVDASDEPPPCEDAHRLAAADVVASMLGFGVFLADGAIISKTRYIDRADPNAALGEIEFVFDIALFLTLHDLPPDGAERFLKSTLAELLKSALRDAAPFRRVLLAARGA